MKTYQKVLILLALILFAFPAKVFLFMKFFEWFIVPTFHVSTLTIGQTIGLIFFFQWVIPQGKSGKKTSKFWNKEKFWNKALKAIPKTLVRSAILLGLGYAIHLFI